MELRPSLFCLFFCLLYLILRPFKDLGCFSGCLMSSAGIQKLFCGVYSAFTCSFDEFVGEKVVSPSYSSAILGPPRTYIFRNGNTGSTNLFKKKNIFQTLDCSWGACLCQVVRQGSCEPIWGYGRIGTFPWMKRNKLFHRDCYFVFWEIDLLKHLKMGATLGEHLGHPFLSHSPFSHPWSMQHPWLGCQSPSAGTAPVKVSPSLVMFHL